MGPRPPFSKWTLEAICVGDANKGNGHVTAYTFCDTNWIFYDNTNGDMKIISNASMASKWTDILNNHGLPGTRIITLFYRKTGNRNTYLQGGKTLKSVKRQKCFTHRLGRKGSST